MGVLVTFKRFSDGLAWVSAGMLRGCYCVRLRGVFYTPVAPKRRPRAPNYPSQNFFRFSKFSPSPIQSVLFLTPLDTHSAGSMEYCARSKVR